MCLDLDANTVAFRKNNEKSFFAPPQEIANDAYHKSSSGDCCDTLRGWQ